MSTVTIIGIIGGVIVLALVGVVVMLMSKKTQPKRKRSGPKPLTDLPSNDTPNPLPLSEDISDEEEVPSDEETVGSWEELPAGDYLDPDENGTVWFRANDGDNWYQNSDGTWTKWID